MLRSDWECREPKRSLRLPLLQLLGHLVATATICVSLFATTWAIGVCAAWLNGIHPFGDQTFRFVTKVEAWALYGDTGLCFVVSMLCMWQFCKEVMR